MQKPSWPSGVRQSVCLGAAPAVEEFVACPVTRRAATTVSHSSMVIVGEKSRRRRFLVPGVARTGFPPRAVAFGARLTSGQRRKEAAPPPPFLLFCSWTHVCQAGVPDCPTDRLPAAPGRRSQVRRQTKYFVSRTLKEPSKLSRTKDGGRDSEVPVRLLLVSTGTARERRPQTLH